MRLSYGLYSLYLFILLFSVCLGHADHSGSVRSTIHGGIQHFEYITWSHLRIHSAVRKSVYDSIQTKDAEDHVPGHLDSFLLELDAYNKTFCLHMHPNYELLHPEARTVTPRSFGRTIERQLSAKVFRGYVVAMMDHSDPVEFAEMEYRCDWMSSQPSYENYGETLGWARLVVHDNRFQSVSLRKRSLMAQESVEYEGVFVTGKDIYTIKSIQQYMRSKRSHDIGIPESHKRPEAYQSSTLMVYTNHDLRLEHAHASKLVDNFCGANDLHWNVDQEDGAHAFYQKVKRAVDPRKNEMGDFVNALEHTDNAHLMHLSKRVAAGCPLRSKVIYMGVVADCSYIQIHGSQEAAQSQIISNWNTVSGIYEQHFNVYIGLVEIVMMPNCGSEVFNKACTSSYTISNRLSDFSQWRGTKDNSAGLWHLMSNCSTRVGTATETRVTVGLAWTNMVCQTQVYTQNSNSSVAYVSGTAVSTTTAYEWMVVAHEIGHNFGASHDCTDSLCQACSSSTCTNCCPCYPSCDCKDLFLMNPTNDMSPNNPQFSSCSQTDICTKYPSFGTCLEDPGSKEALNGGICGNGIQEKNEQCDCGGPSKCAGDPCCFSNCTLKAQAVCSDKNHGCCKNCTILPASSDYVCRPAQGFCDVPETCAGNATCPTDTFKTDGISCSNDTSSSNLKCATGACTSRDLQCKAFGSSNIVGECSSLSGQCSMFCRIKPEGCTKVAGYFRDGTPCGASGLCYKGKCSTPDLVGGVIEWILVNQNIATVFGVVGGVIIFILIGKCIKFLSPKKRTAVALSEQLQKDQKKMERYNKLKQQQNRARGSDRNPRSEASLVEDRSKKPQDRSQFYEHA